MNYCKMKKRIIENITFKTTTYYRNYEYLSEKENIVTHYDGMLYKLRIIEKKPPLPLGEYEFTIWNIGIGKELGINVNELISNYGEDVVFTDFKNLIKNKNLNTLKYDNLVLISYFILNPDFRKIGLTQEFVKMIYKNFYNKKNAIIVYAKPIQHQLIDETDFFFKYKLVNIREHINPKYDTPKSIPAIEYYAINQLKKKEDREMNEYKVFSVASKYGFKRIGETNFFILQPTKENLDNMFKSKIF